MVSVAAWISFVKLYFFVPVPNSITGRGVPDIRSKGMRWCYHQESLSFIHPTQLHCAHPCAPVHPAEQTTAYLTSFLLPKSDPL